MTEIIAVIVGFALNEVWHYFKGQFGKPVLKILIGDGTRFISRNPKFVQNPNGQTQQVADSMYVRVKVTNEGKQTARNCVAYLTGVEKWNGFKFEETEYADDLRLVWSHNPGTPAMELVRGSNYWLDVLSTDSRTHAFYLETAVKPFRYEQGFTAPGRYRFTVQVSDDGVEPQTVPFFLNWDGNWKRFQICDEKTWDLLRAQPSGGVLQGTTTVP